MLLITGGGGGSSEFSSDTWKGGCDLRQTAEGSTIRSTSTGMMKRRANFREFTKEGNILWAQPHPLRGWSSMLVGLPFGFLKVKKEGSMNPTCCQTTGIGTPREWFHPGSVREFIVSPATIINPLFRRVGDDWECLKVVFSKRSAFLFFASCRSLKRSLLASRSFLFRWDVWKLPSLLCFFCGKVCYYYVPLSHFYWRHD